MKREIYKKLLEWKDRSTRKPLILEGARQVGKTYILQAFGRNEYDNMLYINCHNNSFMEELFSIDFDMDRVLLGLSTSSLLIDNFQCINNKLPFDRQISYTSPIRIYKRKWRLYKRKLHLYKRNLQLYKRHLRL